jgi:predicted secreted protein
MALAKGISGRKAELSIDSVALGTAKAGVRVKTLAWANEMIDVSSEDGGAWRILLDEPASSSCDLTVSGVMKETTLAELAANSYSVVAACVLGINGIGTWSGDFAISGFTITGDHKDAVTFEATLQSADEITFTVDPT